MISSIDNGVNAVKLFNATNAFKSSALKSQETEGVGAEAQLGTDIKENSILGNVNVDEIKQFAHQIGENNFSEDDIKYGLKYGRSVLMDCSA